MFFIFKQRARHFKNTIYQCFLTGNTVGPVVLLQQHYLRFCMSVTVPKVLPIHELDRLTRLNWQGYPEFDKQLSRQLRPTIFVLLSKTLCQLNFAQMSQGLLESSFQCLSIIQGATAKLSKNFELILRDLCATQS